MIHLSKSAEQTQAIAADFSRSLRGGECLALHGDLGAGKTQFVRGLLQGLGGDVRSVSSPTYMLLNVYETGRLIVYHLDAYRVNGVDDFEAIGFSELLEQGGIVVVEWASRIADLLPKDHLEIRIEAIGPNGRRITL
ncbi:MAG TPA: tRNA (adenosine(37)-N6)-threonylcarbamoyltransferase complex ATPase subunit type 1 TsaE [Tepidisphaeraceae bacterium]|nr:tRNA (adenosine(37)-N6)-threonylcarbamoyltransferase complex ATPase subunit type 1 TsaE [Tepidisphaeraceae bacterium]